MYKIHTCVSGMDTFKSLKVYTREKLKCGLQDDVCLTLNSSVICT